MRPLAPALGALVPLLPLPVAELNGVYCLRLHISPPDWAVPTICDADWRYRPHSEWRNGCSSESFPASIRVFGHRRVSQLRPADIAAWRMTIASGHRFEARRRDRRAVAAGSALGAGDGTASVRRPGS